MAIDDDVRMGRETPPNRGAPEPAPEPSEFERFENLTRKLVRVPKSEVDEKRRTPKPQ